MKFSQVPHTILMVRPAAFGFNPETAASNAFQKQAEDKSKVQENALLEFDRVIDVLTKHQIPTIVIEDTRTPITTDAVFPNNWITTHEDGKIILYPMMAPSRRNERRADIVELLKEKFVTADVIDLSKNEDNGIFLEGTGSIIFDHVSKITFACRSVRTDEKLFNDLCNRLGYKPILFTATDENGLPIYHTNVMMWVGSSLAGICLDAIRKEEEQEMILGQLASSNHKVIALSFEQMNSFAGNMFEVMSTDNKHFLLLSQAAYESLLPGQIIEMEKHVELLALDIRTIEESGGGSIRCMVAGIHLSAR